MIENNDRESICCVCGHPLSYHFDEGKWWRCHGLGQDAYQCECRLFKDEEWGIEPKLEDYDLDKRVQKQIEDLRQFRDKCQK